MNPTYLATARMLTEVAPIVIADGTFAVKGGTAINLFLREMPRLSVDLDLVFPDHRPSRSEALAAINEALRNARSRLAERGFHVQTVSAADMGETKLLVRRDDILVKVEVNTVIRGTVYPTRTLSLSAAARNALMADLDLPLLSAEDIYGGKLVAAMDRQHPRDLFDVMELFAHEGITPGIRRSFVVYLASHNRTFHEVLFPTPRDIRLDYEGTFVGMTTEPVTLDALLETRARLFRELPAALDANERQFLRTLARAEPDWLLLEIPHLELLPAVRWKLQNLQRLARTNPTKLRALGDALEQRLQELP
jgi:predicted nucleotidyltransferase component of viral defense system